MRRLLPILLVLTLCGCVNPYFVTPPAPTPPPVVDDPVAPDALTYAQVEAIRPAMTRAEVVELLGEPKEEFAHDDGTTDLVWPAVDSEGVARRLEVRLSEGAVISRVLF
jgi:hypothetical protein